MSQVLWAMSYVQDCSMPVGNTGTISIAGYARRKQARVPSSLGCAHPTKVAEHSSTAMRGFSFLVDLSPSQFKFIGELLLISIEQSSSDTQM